MQQQFADLNSTADGLRKSLVSSKMEYKELHQKHLDFNTVKTENEKLLKQVRSFILSSSSFLASLFSLSVPRSLQSS
jgi:hypothetical protein